MPLQMLLPRKVPDTVSERPHSSGQGDECSVASTEDIFGRMVEQAFEELPTEYREACKDLSIRVEELASTEVMSALHLTDPHQLLGLYHGISLAKKTTFQVQMLPNEVLIYREAITAYAAARGYALRDVVRHVLVHEIGHHFGFSDADMEAIERQD